VKVSTEASPAATNETPLEDDIAKEKSQDQNQVAGGQDGQKETTMSPHTLEEQEKMDTDPSTEEPTERMTEEQMLENKQEQTKNPKITTV